MRTQTLQNGKKLHFNYLRLFDCSSSNFAKARMEMPITTTNNPLAVTKSSLLWSDETNFGSLPYYKSCCLHLAFRIKCNDSYFCIGKLSLTSFYFTDHLIRIGASEHW